MVQHILAITMTELFKYNMRLPIKIDQVTCDFDDEIGNYKYKNRDSDAECYNDYYESLKRVVSKFIREQRPPLPVNTPSIKFSMDIKLRKNKEEVEPVVKYETLNLKWVQQPLPYLKPSHVDGLRGIMSEELPLKDGWTAVDKKGNRFRVAMKENLCDTTTANQTKSRLCVSVTKGIECPNVKKGDICNFAHSVLELSCVKCKFRECRNIRYVYKNEKFENIPGAKPCEFLHHNETLENYCQRLCSPAGLLRKSDLQKKHKVKTDDNNNSIQPQSDLLSKKLKWLSTPALKNTTEVQSPKIIQLKDWKKPEVKEEQKSSWTTVNEWKRPESKEDQNLGWTTVKKSCKNKGKSKSRIEETRREEDESIVYERTYIFTKMCRYAVEKQKCPHRVCMYAHKEEDIKVKNCDFDKASEGRKCANVVCVTDALGGRRYKNLEDRKICRFKHEFESIGNLLKRTAVQ